MFYGLTGGEIVLGQHQRKCVNACFKILFPVEQIIDYLNDSGGGIEAVLDLVENSPPVCETGIEGGAYLYQGALFAEHSEIAFTKWQDESPVPP